MNNVINLAELPPPQVVESLDYETILGEMLKDLRSRLPEFTATVESDPAYKILEVAAYRELLIRQRVNDAARSVMVPYSKGPDLDNLAALFQVSRKVLNPGNPNTVPPIPPSYEKDEQFRQRLPLSLDGFSTAGPTGGYHFHALDASGKVKDACVSSPHPGEVLVTLLSIESEDGTPSKEVISTVQQYLNDDDIRPLCDKVIVKAAEVISYKINAVLEFSSGPDRSLILERARAEIRGYVDRQHGIGRDVIRSGLYAALHQPGVHKVDLKEPLINLSINQEQVAFCTEIIVSDGGINE